jgi:hypothetical protein
MFMQTADHARLRGQNKGPQQTAGLNGQGSSPACQTGIHTFYTYNNFLSVKLHWMLYRRVCTRTGSRSVTDGTTATVPVHYLQSSNPRISLFSVIERLHVIIFSHRMPLRHYLQSSIPCTSLFSHQTPFMSLFTIIKPLYVII